MQKIRLTTIFLLITTLTLSLAQPSTTPVMKVGTIAQSDGVVKALLIVAAEDGQESLQVTAAMDPDGQQVMPNKLVSV